VWKSAGQKDCYRRGRAVHRVRTRTSTTTAAEHRKCANDSRACVGGTLAVGLPFSVVTLRQFRGEVLSRLEALAKIGDDRFVDFRCPMESCGSLFREV
jgi:hypothetical protein